MGGEFALENDIIVEFVPVGEGGESGAGEPGKRGEDETLDRHE